MGGPTMFLPNTWAVFSGVPRTSGRDKAPSTHPGAPLPPFPLHYRPRSIEKTRSALLGSNGKGDGGEATISDFLAKASCQRGMQTVAPSEWELSESCSFSRTGLLILRSTLSAPLWSNGRTRTRQENLLKVKSRIFYNSF